MNSFLKDWVRIVAVLWLFVLVTCGYPLNTNSSVVEDDHPIIVDADQSSSLRTRADSASGKCFPAIGFKIPQEPPASVNNWWCNQNSEYAFMGFSYEVTACQNFNQLKREFSDIRNRFQGRYVRIYGACDRKGFYDDVINAAWQAGIGVHALIWFGFDGGNAWRTRRDALFSTLHSNQLAKFVVRTVQFGSEPLFDGVLSPSELAKQVNQAKAQLASLHISVTVSDMAYSYQKNNGARQVMSAIDVIDVHMLPFFAYDASTARNAWPLVQRDLDWFVQNGQGKKIYLSQNGWPSTTYPGVKPNSNRAVANVQNEHDYYNLLDAHCSYFKMIRGGGVGWFAHIYSDSQEPGYGIYDTRGKLKFPFNARASC